MSVQLVILKTLLTPFKNRSVEFNALKDSYLTTMDYLYLIFSKTFYTKSFNTVYYMPIICFVI